MGKVRAISEIRNVNVTFDDGTVAQIAAPIDSYKAALKAVEVTESRFNELGAAGAPDLTDVTVILTGALPFQVHVFTLTTVMATGSYEFVYVETKPNAAA